MRILILLALVGLSLAAPQNPQVYAYDYFNHEENRAQFLRRNGDTYSWGYEFPERVHLESRDGVGLIMGSYGYVDANGAPILVQYQANPENGFTVEIQEAQSVQSFPASRSESVAPAVVEVSPYSALVKEVPVVPGNLAAPTPLLAMVAPTPVALTPTLKAAVQAGRITHFEVLEDDSSTFAVSPEAVQEAGSVSNLAYSLGRTNFPRRVARSPRFKQHCGALGLFTQEDLITAPHCLSGISREEAEIVLGSNPSSNGPTRSFSRLPNKHECPTCVRLARSLEATLIEI